MMKKNSTIFLLSVALISLCVMSLRVSAQTVIGGNTPDPSAMLDVQGNNRGVLLPRMTTTDRDAIASPALGLMLFNTTSGCLEINLGTSASALWQRIECIVGTINTLDCGNARFSGSNFFASVPASGQFLRIPYTGGDGYSHQGQVVHSTGVTGLTATLAPGTFTSGADSLTYTITGTAASSGLASFALNIGGKTCTLNIPVGCGAYVAAGVWKVFSCYNLGAISTTIDPFIPNWELIGDYWQWGKLLRAVSGPTGPNAGDANSGVVAGWNTTASADTDWLDASKTGNDPCPPGFRIPTLADWQGVLDNSLNPKSNIGTTWTDSPTNYTTGKKFGSSLFLPATGTRDPSDGTLFTRGNYADYWSSTANPTTIKSYYIYFGNNYFGSANTGRTFGMSIRCVQL